jgi:2-amino-4-hydroxy-6-hydroxymethyldihydropteridine diphosphokinase
MAQTFACIGIGANLGDRAAHVALAAARLREAPTLRDVRLSPTYETEPVGPIDQPPYLNAAAAVTTSLPARDLLTVLRGIEAEAGRAAVDQRVRWGPRELDLDVLLYGDKVIDEPGLAVPHPRMHERWFVLKPLADVAPDAIHPLLGKSVRALLAEVEASEATHDR